MSSSTRLKKSSNALRWNDFVIPFCSISNNIISNSTLHLVLGGHGENDLKWNRWHGETFRLGDREKEAIWNAAGVEGG